MFHCRDLSLFLYRDISSHTVSPQSFLKSDLNININLAGFKDIKNLSYYQFEY